MRGENAEFPDEFSWIRLKIRLEVKMEQKKKKKSISKRKFAKIRENFAILQRKIHWIRSKMRAENAEFQSEFNWIRLKIRVEVKMVGKRRKSRFESEISQNLEIIWEFYKGKFTESDLKWEKKMQNLQVNSTEFDWRFESN